MTSKPKPNGFVDPEDLDLFDEWAVDEAAARHGVWTQIGRHRFKIARHGNPEFTHAYMRAHQKLGRPPTDPEKVDLLLEALAHGVLRDWEVRRRGSDEPVPYTPAQGLATLKRYPDLADGITEFARTLDNYRASTLAEQEKNSGLS